MLYGVLAHLEDGNIHLSQHGNVRARQLALGIHLRFHPVETLKIRVSRNIDKHPRWLRYLYLGINWSKLRPMVHEDEVTRTDHHRGCALGSMRHVEMNVLESLTKHVDQLLSRIGIPARTLEQHVNRFAIANRVQQIGKNGLVKGIYQVGHLWVSLGYVCGVDDERSMRVFGFDLTDELLNPRDPLFGGTFASSFINSDMLGIIRPVSGGIRIVRADLRRENGQHRPVVLRLV